MKKKYWVSSVITILVLFLTLILLDEELPYHEKKVVFIDSNDTLSGILHLPKNSKEPFPLLLFLHGDGEMPYDAYGYYTPLWKSLAQNGIASFSWDKKGVGNSTGNWLHQSMEMRADEVISAINEIQKQPSIKKDAIGIIGFSQGGWVLPIVAHKYSQVNFMISVSGAINWISQGEFFTKNRMLLEGHSQDEIDQTISDFHKSNNTVLQNETTYEEYLSYTKENDSPMSKDRFIFVKKNWRSDARDYLKSIQCPTLAVFGEKDINVNINESIQVYREEFSRSGNTNLTIKTYPTGQHGILRNDLFPGNPTGLGFLLKLSYYGDDAFAGDYLEYVPQWILSTVK